MFCKILTIRYEYDIILYKVIGVEKRYGKLIASYAGGIAAKGSKTYKVSIPSNWVKELGLDEKNRNIELVFDGEKICIQPETSAEEFVLKKKEKAHKLYRISFLDREILCTVIYADFTDNTIKIENHTENVLKTAFGNNFNPLWTDFEDFLRERCISKDRSGIREYLEAIGMDEYNPFEIIKRTEGRMAEDNQWVRVEVI